MSVRRATAVLVVAAALGQTPAVGAAPPSSAERLVEAVERGHRGLAAVRPALSERAVAVDREITACEHLVEGDHPEAVENRIEETGAAVVWSALLWPYVEATLPVARQVVADMDAVPTRDPALRSGRAAWRRGVRLFASFPPPVERPCEALARWRDAGFSAAAAPIPRADALRFWKLLARTDDERDRRYGKAVRRLRQLGLSPRRARRFDGRRIFDLYSDDH